MTISVLFWILWIIGFIFGGVVFNRTPVESRWTGGVSFLLYILLGMLGWAVFGSPIKG